MKKRFNFFYLVAVLDVILAVIRFAKGDMLMGAMWICVGISMLLLGGLGFAKRKMDEDENRV